MSVHYMLPERDNMRRAVGSFTAGVTVVTTHGDSRQPIGMTATAFTAVSADPPSVLVCLSRRARTPQVIREQGRFGVNVLSSDGQAVSDYCASPGDDKTLPESWLHSGGARTPMLRQALSYFDCEVQDVLEQGGHVVIIGQVIGIGLAAERESTDPLLHSRGRYRHLSPVHPGQRLDPLPIVFDPENTLEVYHS